MVPKQFLISHQDFLGVVKVTTQSRISAAGTFNVSAAASATFVAYSIGTFGVADSVGTFDVASDGAFVVAPVTGAGASE